MKTITGKLIFILAMLAIGWLWSIQVIESSHISLEKTTIEFLSRQRYDNCLSREKRAALQEEVKDMFVHAWSGYVKFAEPADELQPLSCVGRRTRSRGNMDDILGNFSLTLIDTLDTLPVFGMTEEFHRAVWSAIEHVRFDRDVDVNLFEVTIRVLGGLLSAHLLAGGGATANPHHQSVPGLPNQFVVPGYSGELLELAANLGARLLPAFHSPTGIPYSKINLVHGVARKESPRNCLAGAGTLMLEFGVLSKLTGDPVYYRRSHAALRKLALMRPEQQNLVPDMVDLRAGVWLSNRTTIGAGSDSFYEYLLKAHLLFGATDRDEELLASFHAIYGSIQRHLWKDGWYIPTHTNKPGQAHAPVLVDALLDFWPALQVLYGQVDDALLAYRRMWQLVAKYGLPPENYFPYQDSNAGTGYLLRPEFIESTYFLYRATKDPFFLHVGEHMLRQLQLRTKTPCGHAAVRDVSTNPHDHSRNLEDTMDSFFLTETLKYLYLLFADDDHFLHRHNYIFTTEAHMFPIVPEFSASHSPDPLVRRPCFPPDQFYHPDASWPDYHSYLISTANHVISISNQQHQQHQQQNQQNQQQQNQPHQQQENDQHQEGEYFDTDIFPKPQGVSDEEYENRVKAQMERVNKQIIHMQSEMRTGYIIELITASPYMLHLDRSFQSTRDRELSSELVAHLSQQGHPLDLVVMSSYESVSYQLSPGHIQVWTEDGRKMEAGGAMFGPSFFERALPALPLVAVDYFGCEDGDIKESLVGKVALVSRGACTFVEKVARAEQAGAEAVIVYNDSPELLVSFRMSGNLHDASIPAAFVGLEDGLHLLETQGQRVSFIQFLGFLEGPNADLIYFRFHTVGDVPPLNLDPFITPFLTKRIQEWSFANLQELSVAFSSNEHTLNMFRPGQPPHHVDVIFQTPTEIP